MEEFKLKNLESGKSYCIVSHNVEYVARVLEKVLGSVRAEDLLLISPKENVGIDEVRQVADFLAFRPYGKSKWVVIYGADKFTEEAANAFLKTLEEPPDFATIALVTNRYHVLLPTIRSRAIKVFVPVSNLDGLDDLGRFLAMWNYDFVERLRNGDFKITTNLEEISQLEDKLSRFMSLLAFLENATKLDEAGYVKQVDEVAKVNNFEFLQTVAKVVAWVSYSRSDLDTAAKLELLRRCDEIQRSKLANFNYQLAYYSLLLPLKFNVEAQGALEVDFDGVGE